MLPHPTAEEERAGGPFARLTERLWYVVLAGLVGALTAYMCLSAARDMDLRQRFRAEGRSGVGTITGKYISRTGREHPAGSYIIAYEFLTPAGETVEGEAEVRPRQWRLAMKGQDVAVQYLSSEPRLNGLAAAPPWTPLAGHVLRIVLFGGIAIAFLLLAVHAPRRRSEPESVGPRKRQAEAEEEPEPDSKTP